jgi:hypothetical protein
MTNWTLFYCELPNCAPSISMSTLTTKFFVIIVFYSGMDASHPKIWFLYTDIIPAAPQETVEKAGSEPGTAAFQSSPPSCLSHLSHHIPNWAATSPTEPPHHQLSHHIPIHFSYWNRIWPLWITIVFVLVQKLTFTFPVKLLFCSTQNFVSFF